MKSIKKPENTIFYSNYKDMIYNATPEEVKEIMTAFCMYAFDDEEPQVSGQINLLWGIIKGNIDRDRAQYIARCEQNKENANKRHQKEIIYTFNNKEYTFKYPEKNKDNLVSEREFTEDLFSELEDNFAEREKYLTLFVEKGNNDNWNKNFYEYLESVWKIIVDS